MTFINDMVEHIHLLLQKGMAKYINKSLHKCPKDPKQEVKLRQELCHQLRVTLGGSLPNTMLAREVLMENIKAALVVCIIIAAKILNHLRLTVSFMIGTKPWRLDSLQH